MVCLFCFLSHSWTSPHFLVIVAVPDGFRAGLVLPSPKAGKLSLAAEQHQNKTCVGAGRKLQLKLKAKTRRPGVRLG